MDQEEKTKKVHKTFRVLNIIFAIIAVAVAILRIIFYYSGANFGFWFVSIYTIIFAFMLFVASVKWKAVLNQFTFLRSLVGQGFFILFMSALLFNWEIALDLIYSLVGIVYSIFVILMACKYPSKELESDEDFEKKRKELEKEHKPDII